MKGRASDGGFTLVEVIVALGIIAFLTVLAAPALAVHRTMAEKTVTSANARTIATEVQITLSDSAGAAASRSGYGVAEVARALVFTSLRRGGAASDPVRVVNPVSGADTIVNATALPGERESKPKPPAAWLTDAPAFTWDEYTKTDLTATRLSGTIVVAFDAADSYAEVYWVDRDGNKSPTVERVPLQMD